MINENPHFYDKQKRREVPSRDELDENITDKVSAEEVYYAVCDICDPEYVNSTFEELNIVQEGLITVDSTRRKILLFFVPTVPTCSMATIIGLCLKTVLTASYGPYYRVVVKIKEGTHVSEEAINRQVNDKERVQAALENGNILSIIRRCLLGLRAVDNRFSKHILM